MDLLIALVVFSAVMIMALWKGFSMILALLVGFAAFMLVGRRRGFSWKSLWKMSGKGAKDSLIVVEVMCLIGFVTASWRAAGTITIFVYYGMKLITPSCFLIVAFVLSSLLSYALGTSFGVAGTVGVIFMTLARSGGVDPVLTAGVLMSGVYFGDRTSPVSSSANLVAGVTGTRIFENVKMMLRTCVIPILICLAIYSVFSFMNPISHVDENLVQTFEETFVLSRWAFLPAVIMLVLPILKVSVMLSMFLSVLSGILVAYSVQGMSLLNILRSCVLGYQAEGEGLAAILNGGGLVSMLEIIGILFISCAFSGIFSGTRMLEGLQSYLTKGSRKVGRFLMMCLLSLGCGVVFCNQSISTIMCNDLLKETYLGEGGSMEELAIDMENSLILITCMIPWAIGCSVPLAFFDVSIACLPYAVFMYLMPVFYFFTKKRWYREHE